MTTELTTLIYQTEILKYPQSANQRFKSFCKLDLVYFFIALEAVGQLFVSMNHHINRLPVNHITQRLDWWFRIHRTMFIPLPYFVTSHKQHLHHAAEYEVNEYLWLKLVMFLNLRRSTRCTWMTKFLGLGKKINFVFDRFNPFTDRWFIPSFTIYVDQRTIAACYVIASECSHFTFGAEHQLDIRRKHKYAVLKILRYCKYSRCYNNLLLRSVSVFISSTKLSRSWMFWKAFQLLWYPKTTYRFVSLSTFCNFTSYRHYWLKRF
jgi:hypothetical protein